MSEHPWERQQGESPQAYLVFECYRRIAAGERSLQRAWQDHCNQPGQARQRRGKEAGRPHGHWTRWMFRWRWQERALAWDEEVSALARDQELDRELKARLATQEEELRQRRLRKEEALAACTVARRMLLRVLQAVDAGQLDQLALADLLPHLAKVSTLLEVGQKLDRLLSGEPTDITRRETDTRETVGKLVGIMQEFCPPERWQELAEKINGIEADE